MPILSAYLSAGFRASADLFFPFILALGVWDSSWATWLRLFLVGCFARVVARLLASEEDRAMRALVAAGSKHGATEEIADAIGRVLRERGLETDVRSIDDVVDTTEYEAFVLGSAVHAGHWLEPARRFVEERGNEPG